MGYYSREGRGCVLNALCFNNTPLPLLFPSHPSQEGNCVFTQLTIHYSQLTNSLRRNPIQHRPMLIHSRGKYIAHRAHIFLGPQVAHFAGAIKIQIA